MTNVKIDPVRFAVLVAKAKTMDTSDAWDVQSFYNTLSEGVVDNSKPSVDVGDFIAFCDALRDGRKIDAIKLYRQISGWGLKESKDAVEALETATGQTY